MTQQTVTITYDDKNIHDTLVVRASDPQLAGLANGAVVFMMPDEKRVKFSVLNVGDLTVSKMAACTQTLTQYIVQNAADLV
jgi:hypothetical protein